jgi:hypothetical protein
MIKKLGGITNDYQIRPNQREKFKAAEAREVIRAILKKKLENLGAEADMGALSRQIADRVKYQLKDLGKGRYTGSTRPTEGTRCSSCNTLFLGF